MELKVKPNFKTLGKDFGQKTHSVVEMINEHALMIAEHVKNNKPYINDGIEITTNHVIIEKVCPNDYIMSEIRGGNVYLNKVVTASLELEGYAREIVRRIQQLRKDSNLQKRDVIDVFIATDLKIEEYKDMILEKVGARNVTFSSTEGSYASITETIKGKEVKISFNKV